MAGKIDPVVTVVKQKYLEEFLLKEPIIKQSWFSEGRRPGPLRGSFLCASWNNWRPTENKLVEFRRFLNKLDIFKWNWLIPAPQIWEFDPFDAPFNVTEAVLFLKLRHLH